MKQIKEKPERIKGLKEHVRTAPKEVLQCSVSGGTERMKEHLNISGIPGSRSQLLLIPPHEPLSRESSTSKRNVIGSP